LFSRNSRDEPIVHKDKCKYCKQYLPVFQYKKVNTDCPYCYNCNKDNGIYLCVDCLKFEIVRLVAKHMDDEDKNEDKTKN
jgi:hypothetical protein